jgi:hypothetical protein
MTIPIVSQPHVYHVQDLIQLSDNTFTDVENNTLKGWALEIPKSIIRLHPKIRFYVVAIANGGTETTTLVGQWIEMEAFAVANFTNLALSSSVSNDGAILSYYVFDANNNWIVNLSGTTTTTNTTWTYYIERVSFTDSDFEQSQSWLNPNHDNSIRHVVQPLPDNIPDFNVPPTTINENINNPIIPVIG